MRLLQEREIVLNLQVLLKIFLTRLLIKMYPELSPDSGTHPPVRKCSPQMMQQSQRTSICGGSQIPNDYSVIIRLLEESNRMILT